MAQDNDVLFSTDDWVEVYQTTDEWEAKLIQTTLANQQIRCKTAYKPGADRRRRIVLFVAPDDQVEALEAASRISLAVAHEESIKQQAARGENRKEKSPKSWSKEELPKATPTAVESVIIAEREGVGKIVHHVGRCYELQVGNEPYSTVEEERWEEFTDFSAQRQEFAILLKHEYPSLFEWLRQEKLMAEFIRLVESTYREVPPPRPRRQRNAQQQNSLDATEARTSNVAKFSLWTALISLAGALLQLPWYVCLILSLAAATAGFIAKYQIDSSNGTLKGSLLAFLAIIVACVVIAITWKQHQLEQPEPSDLRGMNIDAAPVVHQAIKQPANSSRQLPASG